MKVTKPVAEQVNVYVYYNLFCLKTIAAVSPKFFSSNENFMKCCL